MHKKKGKIKNVVVAEVSLTEVSKKSYFTTFFLNISILFFPAGLFSLDIFSSSFSRSLLRSNLVFGGEICSREDEERERREVAKDLLLRKRKGKSAGRSWNDLGLLLCIMQDSARSKVAMSCGAWTLIPK